MTLKFFNLIHLDIFHVLEIVMLSDDLPKLSAISDFLTGLKLPTFELGTESILPDYLGETKRKLKISFNPIML